MTGEQIWLVMAAGGAVALALSVCCALLWRTSRRLATRLSELESERRTPHATARQVVAEPSPYVITELNDGDVNTVTDIEGVVSARIDGALFADIVARESVVKVAGLAHGLRRALSAETRNRIRFEMKREVKRSRKQRRADVKSAMRDFQTRDRAGMAEDKAEGDAA